MRPGGCGAQRADLLPTQYAAAVESTGGVPVLLPPVSTGSTTGIRRRRGRGRRAARRVGDQRRCRRRPGDVRRACAPEDRRLATRPRRLGVRVARRGRGDRVAGAGRLPRHAGDGRPRWRRRPTSTSRTWSATRGTPPAATSSGPSGWSPLPEPVSRHSSATGCPSTATTTRRCARTPGYAAVAYAADGTLEAIEAPGDRFCVGVQWHPETAADVGLLAGLVRAAAAYASER